MQVFLWFYMVNTYGFLTGNVSRVERIKIKNVFIAIILEIQKLVGIVHYARTNLVPLIIWATKVSFLQNKWIRKTLPRSFVNGRFTCFYVDIVLDSKCYLIYKDSIWYALNERNCIDVGRISHNIMSKGLRKE